MIDLTEKYRPKRYADVVGQEKVADELRSQSFRDKQSIILLSGPHGTGKTSLGLIYARSLLCLSPKDGEWCGTCEACVSYSKERNYDFHYVPCGERSRIEDIRDVLDQIKTAPLLSRKRVHVLDEVAGLSKKAFEALLNVTENTPHLSSLILLTTNPEHISPPLFSRLTEFKTKLIGVEAAVQHLSRICSAEEIPYERDGLIVLHAELKGHVRSMVGALQKCASYGRVDVSTVKGMLGLNVMSQLDEFFDALCRGDLQAQIDVIQAWDENATRKLTLLHRYLVECYFSEIRQIRSGDLLMHGADAASRLGLITLLESRAVELQADLGSLWQGLIDKYEPRDSITDPQLRMVITKANDALGKPTAIRRIKQKKQGSKRLIGVGSAEVQAGYLPWSKIEPHWRAASFLMQHYGQTFNVRTTVHHHGTAQGDHESGADLVSQFTHQLGMRISEWWIGTEQDPDRFHWEYRHETDEYGWLVTRIAIAMPYQFIKRAQRWASKFFVARQQRREVLRYHFAFRTDATSQTRFHWQSIRAFSRSLDPSVLAKSERGDFAPLTDLLNIPRRLQAPVAAGVKCARARGSSKTLTPTAQRRAHQGLMPFLSALQDQVWKSIDSGWELVEHLDRLRELERRGDIEAKLRARFNQHDQLDVAKYTHELAALRASYPSDPRKMLRSWGAWWREP
ncbi:AAA family ATPase [Bradyrhizobium sp. BRP56]|uniref:DNA polymerase III subunit n=1 Tax=Bradyrhizobium sp. BRP56 TaxID=2793819 RepID=UPI001CD2F8AD|nr:AAA family ATPase [Bradyrhizobium sp. BRP56]MCA1398399.1 AAA family ATPase [Bradyrhizobium sp. BRP56]